MAKYQQYEEYKDSTVIWLKDLLPKTWTLSRIKYLCYVNDGNHGEEYPKESDYTDSQNGVPFIRGGNLGNYAITDEGMLYITHIKNNSMRKGRLKKGDILFVNRGEIGKLALVTEKHAGSNLNSQIAYLRVNNNKLINKYLLYYLDSSYVSNFLVSMKMGSVLTQFPIGDLLDIHVPLPLAEEQIQIANFLDHETAQIDTLIEKQQTLIQLLKEKRQAVISHAVTKGLNSDAPMKDSGVEWLGEVPEHWAVIKLANYAIPLNGDRGSNYPSGNDFVDEGVFFISTSEVVDGYVKTDTASKITLKKYNQLGGLKIKKGDIIYCLRGSVGKSGICTFDEGTISSSLMGIRSMYIDPYYLILLLTSSSELQQRLMLVTGSVSANLSAQNVMGYKFAIPEKAEQLIIIAHVKNSLERIDILLSKATQAIQLMQERRTALISAAVTGKIDVRGWQAPDNKAS